MFARYQNRLISDSFARSRGTSISGISSSKMTKFEKGATVAYGYRDGNFDSDSPLSSPASSRHESIISVEAMLVPDSTSAILTDCDVQDMT